MLSIVIPTRNRANYTMPTIKNILSIFSSQLELIVQDSSDTRVLEELVNSNISDSRLRYSYSEPLVIAVANYS